MCLFSGCKSTEIFLIHNTLREKNVYLAKNRHFFDGDGLVAFDFHKIDPRRETLGWDDVAVALHHVGVTGLSLKVVHGQHGIFHALARCHHDEG